MEQLFKTELEDVEINIHPSNLQETIYGANAEIDFNISLDVRSYGIKDASIEIQRISGSDILAHEDGNEDFRIVIREIIIDIEKGGSTITVNL